MNTDESNSEPRMHTDARRSSEDMDSLTEAVIGCAFRVQNELGCGFLEKVYENALALELTKAGLQVRQQAPVHVFYDGKVVGDYIADLVVENRLLLELKAIRGIDDIHAAQCLNYLKATGFSVCLLLNFGRPRLQIKRYANERSSRLRSGTQTSV